MIALLSAVGKIRGRMSNKDNRAAKLIAMWDELRDKFSRMIVRGRCETEHSRYAYACLLMMETGIRIGNEDSAEGFTRVGERNPNAGDFVQTYGLTTLCGRHVSLKKREMILSFTGKKVVEQQLNTSCSVLVDFAPQVRDNDLWLDIDANRLRKFVTKFVGHKFTPKDLRTAKVNLLFLSLWERVESNYQKCEKRSERNRLLSLVIDNTAEKIGHTKAVCRNSYLSKSLIDEIRCYGL